MKKRTISLVVVLLALLSFLPVAPAGAQAAPATKAAVVTAAAVTPATAAPAAVTAAASNPCGGSAYACADGNFYAWNGHNGSRCQWAGNAPNLGNCRNTDYLIANYGYPCAGCDWIHLFYSPNYSGAYFCLPPGYAYGQATSPGLTFNKGAGRAGYGQSIWYNAASASWGAAC
ncbi:hypothetical protein [Catenulispora rubra]|uniref:hypothetical protein n=1 Tax=Catenulispora rubra TaxID=280293 RepID=UPI001892825B|nr:hypothetical protein [Catenulispora rubra]